MKRIILVGAVLALGFLSGCTSMNTPSASLIDEVPVVKVGSGDIPSKDFVIYIPAHTAFPVGITIGGNAFDEALSLNTKASLSNDLYLYQSWASRDGRNWIPSYDMLNLSVSVGATSSGGTAELMLDYIE